MFNQLCYKTESAVKRAHPPLTYLLVEMSTTTLPKNDVQMQGHFLFTCETPQVSLLKLMVIINKKRIHKVDPINNHLKFSF